MIPFYYCEPNDSGPMGLACSSGGSFACTKCGQAPGGGEPETSTQENCRDENPPPGWC